MYKAQTVPKTYHTMDVDQFSEYSENVFVFRTDQYSLHVPAAIMVQLCDVLSALGPKEGLEVLHKEWESRDDAKRRAKIVRNRTAGVAAIEQELKDVLPLSETGVRFDPTGEH